MKDLIPELHHLAAYFIPLLIAFCLPLLTALEREAKARSAGLRTIPLVSVSACTFTMLAVLLFEDSNAQARIISGIITGVDFIGGRCDT